MSAGGEAQNDPGKAREPVAFLREPTLAGGRHGLLGPRRQKAARLPAPRRGPAGPAEEAGRALTAALGARAAPALPLQRAASASPSRGWSRRLSGGRGARAARSRGESGEPAAAGCAADKASSLEFRTCIALPSCRTRAHTGDGCTAPTGRGEQAAQ